VKRGHRPLPACNRPRRLLDPHRGRFAAHGARCSAVLLRHPKKYTCGGESGSSPAIAPASISTSAPCDFQSRAPAIPAPAPGEIVQHGGRSDSAMRRTLATASSSRDRSGPARCSSRTALNRLPYSSCSSRAIGRRSSSCACTAVRRVPASDPPGADSPDRDCGDQQPPERTPAQTPRQRPAEPRYVKIRARAAPPAIRDPWRPTPRRQGQHGSAAIGELPTEPRVDARRRASAASRS